MSPVIRYEIEQAAIAIEVALEWLNRVRDLDLGLRIAVDHIADERKLQHIADRLRALAEEPVS